MNEYVQDSINILEVYFHGEIEILQDEYICGSYWKDEVLYGSKFNDKFEAIAYVNAIVNSDKYDQIIIENDYYNRINDFAPRYVTIVNIIGEVILSGTIRTGGFVEWINSVSDISDRCKIQIKIDELLSESALQASWDNYETAKNLKNKAKFLSMKLL